jgi:fibronectin type 3 domain-containing protein
MMQRTMIKHFLFINLLVLIAVNGVTAQDIQPIAVGTVKGIWVYLGNEIPKGFQYQVYKKQGNGNFNLLGTTTYTEDAATINRKIEEYHGFFNNLEKINEAEIAKMLDYAALKNTTDSIFVSNFPVMHLFFGTAFFDAEAKEGSTYQYRVVKLNGRNAKEWEKTSNTLQYLRKTDLSKPLFKNKQESSSQVLLRWYVTDQKSLNSFNVYRRVFAQGDFMKIPAIKGFNTIQDSLYLIAVDTTVQMPGYYEYCIEPLDIYGNVGTRSDPASAGTIGSAYNPLPEYFSAKGMDKGYQVELSWKFEDKSYLRSIEVYRSTSYDDGFIKIAQLAPNDTSYTDIVPMANENFWYYLKINGPTAQNMPTAKVAAMYRAAGEIPSPPEEVGAESIRGGVKVYWLYDEPHAKGFYVYRYVYENAGYMQVSDMLPAADGEIYGFVDSSGYLQGNEIYRYAVRAVNDVDQMSDYSPSASASPGIKATVKTPLNLSINPSENGLLLIWDDLREEESTLLGYKVYKKTNGEKDYTFLVNDTLRNDRNYFTDTNLMPGKTHSYAVAAIDFYGNESIKSESTTYIQELKYFMPPEISKAVSTPEGIVVEWGQMTGTDAKSVKLYRMQPGEQPSIIATIPIDTGQYLDKDVMNGQLYIYEMSLITGDNRESSKSMGVSVRR